MPRIGDTRNMTLDDAKAIFEDLARAQIRNWRRQAVSEDRIAAIKSKVVTDCAEDAALITDCAKELSAFILAHQELFKKPRKMVTDFGNFGLEHEKELEIADEAKLVQQLLVLGYENCIKTVRTPLKKALTERIKTGETFIGCKIKEGDVAKYKVDSGLMDEVTLTDSSKETLAEA